MLTHLKLGIFIGSTRQDLRDARQAVIDAILSAGHIPSGMELWAAGHTPTLEAIARQLDFCDVHIIILAGRYGSIAKDGISFTEWEYRRSKSQKRPVIAFLCEEHAFDVAIEKITSHADRRKLRKFRSELESHAFCRYFNPENVQTVATDCINSINETINSGKLLPG